ncbi:MAG: DUF2314 domain-containing protein [Steroidobacteraceae bacterium]
MRIDPGIVIGIACGLGVWLFMRWRSPRPEIPPLQTSPDDPLMVDALAKAKSSIDQFLLLAREPRQNAHVKLHFVSNSNQVEHLWAEVLEILGSSELSVRLVTPPVTHSGQLDRLYRCSVEDIEDWQIRDGQGKIHGGFSQRAMFAIARRDGIMLPKKLLKHEAEYTDA